jgi:hypothetical protein
MAEKTDGLAERVARLKAQLLDDVKEILAEEAAGNEDAFVDWLHSFYVGGLEGEKLVDFDLFEQSPLALDMIADWKSDCSNDDERLDLLDHIALRYAAEDFDEPEHFNSVGEPILPYGEPGDEHFDKDGKPIDPYVLTLDRPEGQP